ncbi:MAG TPA: phosphotransferase [Ilumatobacteraceae bacterium]
MRSPFDAISEETLRKVLTERWGLAITELRYLPVGAGAYHWVADTSDHQRYFVTCDDLDTKPWLGSDRDAVFDGLRNAYTTACDLRAGGLTFVIAPIVSNSGVSAERVDDRHSVSVFEHVDGRLTAWGGSLPRFERDQLVSMLAQLHQAPTTGRIAERPFAVPGRADLEAALADLHRPWDGGPLSEAARRELASRLDVVDSLLDQVDHFAAKAASDRRKVVTHGEPHPGNLIHTASGLVMVDWDTVALAQPERDLWMLGFDEAMLVRYERLTHATVDRQALAAHRLMWALTDVVAYTTQLRGQHEAGADAEWALLAIRSILEGEEPSPYGTSP